MNLMGSWPSVSDHIFYLSKLWINENFPKGIISRSLKEQKATPVIILMLSTPMESKVFLLQSLFSPRPHHHKMSCAFRHFPIEIKIGGTRSSELCWDHQPLTSATKKKKERWRQGTLGKNELIRNLYWFSLPQNTPLPIGKILKLSHVSEFKSEI